MIWDHLVEAFEWRAELCSGQSFGQGSSSFFSVLDPFCRNCSSTFHLMGLVKKLGKPGRLAVLATSVLRSLGSRESLRGGCVVEV